VRGKWQQWAALNGRKDFYGLTEADHAAFDVWLAKEAA